MREAQQPYNNRGLHHVFGRHLGEESSIGTPFLWNDRSQMGEVEQLYNNGGLQHVHQTIYLWTIK